MATTCIIIDTDALSIDPSDESDITTLSGAASVFKLDELEDGTLAVLADAIAEERVERGADDDETFGEDDAGTDDHPQHERNSEAP